MDSKGSYSLSRVLQFTQHGWPARLQAAEEFLKPYWSKRMEFHHNQDVCYGEGELLFQKLVDPKFSQELLEAHPGSTRMKRIARTLVWWPGLDKDIEKRVQCCLECQSNQCSPPLSPLQPWKWPTRPWSRLHADFAGPYLGRMFLIIIDAHSKWLEVHPVTSINATVTIQHMRTIFSTFGLPKILVTNNGPSFVS